METMYEINWHMMSKEDAIKFSSIKNKKIIEVENNVVEVKNTETENKTEEVKNTENNVVEVKEVDEEQVRKDYEALIWRKANPNTKLATMLKKLEEAK